MLQKLVLSAERVKEAEVLSGMKSVFVLLVFLVANSCWLSNLVQTAVSASSV